MTDSGEPLADRMRGPDEYAFAMLVERYHALVFRVCMRILKHQQDAEDATQETFSRMAKYLDQWDRNRPIEPWLTTIAGNRSRTFLARRRPHQALSPAIEPAVNDRIEMDSVNQLQEELALAMTQLPERQRVAFELFHEQHLSYAEISDRMGCPLGTAKTWVHRARGQLIDQLRRREVIGPRLTPPCPFSPRVLR